MSDDHSTEAFMHLELWRMLLGSWLGGGIARNVYACALDDHTVIKVESGGRSFQNVMEWEVWQEVKERPEAKWFAPCLHISPNGAVLVQRRTTPAAPGQFPKRMPGFFTDFKRTNFGLLRGRLVAHDYGVHNLMRNGLTAGMRSVKWWDTTDKDMPRGWQQEV